MGSQFSKDSDIGIFMEVNQPYYVAGDQVLGTAYIQAKRNRPYVALQIKLTGKQHVEWKVRRNKKTITYKNDYRNYDNSFTIYNFKGYVPLGQYSFPFSFVLPAMMSGSFTLSQDCFIKYTLSAMLTAQKSDDTQMYKMPLNIIEPPRIKIGPTSNKQSINSKCCNCCMDYGTTSVTLNLSKNMLMNGETFTVSGIIDNSQGSETIQESRVVLEERVKMISTRGNTKQHMNSHSLLAIKKLVKGKSSENFVGEVRIPNEIRGYTAIGRVVARYYVIALYTEYGCCSTPASATQHIILHNKNPSITPKKIVPKPDSWHPQQYPLIVCNSMKPFINQPNRQIIFKNLQGANDTTFAGGNKQPQNNMMMMHYQQTMMELQPEMNLGYQGYQYGNMGMDMGYNQNYGQQQYNNNTNNQYPNGHPPNFQQQPYSNNPNQYPQHIPNNIPYPHKQELSPMPNQQLQQPINMQNIKLSSENNLHNNPNNYQNNGPYNIPHQNNFREGVEPRFNTDNDDYQRVINDV